MSSKCVIVIDATPLYKQREPEKFIMNLKSKNVKLILWSRFDEKTTDQKIGALLKHFDYTLFGHVDGLKSFVKLRAYLHAKSPQLLTLPFILVDGDSSSLARGGFDFSSSIEKYRISSNLCLYDSIKISEDVNAFVSDWISGKCTGFNTNAPAAKRLKSSWDE